MSETFSNLKIPSCRHTVGGVQMDIRGLGFNPILVWFWFSTLLPFCIRHANLPVHCCVLEHVTYCHRLRAHGQVWGSGDWFRAAEQCYKCCCSGDCWMECTVLCALASRAGTRFCPSRHAQWPVSSIMVYFLKRPPPPSTIQVSSTNLSRDSYWLQQSRMEIEGVSLTSCYRQLRL